MLYVFDVDHTLTPSSYPMEDEMLPVMLEFVQTQQVILNTGSDHTKMCWQIPQQIREHCLALYPQLGGECWKGDEQLYKNDFVWPQGLREALDQELTNSQAPDKTGDHVQDRGSMACFSTVGKAAEKPERARYAAFDQQTQEREGIAARLRAQFPGIAFEIGGQTSINISQEGADKSQILTHIRQTWQDPITHFGDKMQPGGTDYPLAQALEQENQQTGKGNINIEVDGWQDTMAHLKQVLAKAA